MGSLVSFAIFSLYTVVWCVSVMILLDYIRVVFQAFNQFMLYLECNFLDEYAAVDFQLGSLNFLAVNILLMCSLFPGLFSGTHVSILQALLKFVHVTGQIFGTIISRMGIHIGIDRWPGCQRSKKVGNTQWHHFWWHCRPGRLVRCTISSPISGLFQYAYYYQYSRTGKVNAIFFFFTKPRKLITVENVYGVYIVLYGLISIFEF